MTRDVAATSTTVAVSSVIDSTAVAVTVMSVTAFESWRDLDEIRLPGSSKSVLNWPVELSMICCTSSLALLKSSDISVTTLCRPAAANSALQLLFVVRLTVLPCTM